MTNSFKLFNVLLLLSEIGRCNQNMLIRDAITFIENRLITIKLNGPLMLQQIQRDFGTKRDVNAVEMRKTKNNKGYTSK